MPPPPPLLGYDDDVADFVELSKKNSATLAKGRITEGNEK